MRDKNIVVTGGGGALGLATVRGLLDMGARVHVPAFGDADARRLEDLGEAGLTVRENVDLTNEAQTAAFYDSIEGLLWGSVHITGGFVWGPIASASLDDLERMWSLNVKTCWLCCREAARRMEGGRIVNVAAKPALVPTPDLATYAATKSAVVGLTLSLAEELKAKNIWVNAIAPSIFDTPANRSSMPKADFDAWPSVADVAATILFLVSPGNVTTRGAIVPVYGRS